MHVVSAALSLNNVLSTVSSNRNIAALEMNHLCSKHVLHFYISKKWNGKMFVIVTFSKLLQWLQPIRNTDLLVRVQIMNCNSRSDIISFSTKQLHAKPSIFPLGCFSHIWCFLFFLSTQRGIKLAGSGQTDIWEKSAPPSSVETLSWNKSDAYALPRKSIWFFFWFFCTFVTYLHVSDHKNSFNVRHK